jgi:hypothetical protein
MLAEDAVTRITHREWGIRIPTALKYQYFPINGYNQQSGLEALLSKRSRIIYSKTLELKRLKIPITFIHIITPYGLTLMPETDTIRGIDWCLVLVGCSWLQICSRAKILHKTVLI